MIARRRMSVIGRLLSTLCSFVGRWSEQRSEWPEWRQRDVFVIDEVRLSQRQSLHNGLRVGHGGRGEDKDDALTIAPLEPLPNLAVKVEANRGADLRRENFDELFARYSGLQRHHHENVRRLRRRGRLCVDRVSRRQQDEARQGKCRETQLLHETSSVRASGTSYVHVLIFAGSLDS